jgi:hypothetical protein
MLLIMAIISVILSYVFFRKMNPTYVLTEIAILISLGLVANILLPWTYCVMILLFGVAGFRIYLKNKNV